MTTKNDIFNQYYEEYCRATRARKGAIIKAVAEVTKMHKKSIIRRFRKRQRKGTPTTECRGRPRYYNSAEDAALRDVWDAANEPCGELLRPLLDDYVAVLHRDGFWKHSDTTTDKLLQMSEMTVRRRVKNFPQVQERQHGLSATKPSHLKSIIPIFKGPWGDLPPGHGQIDTVVHCGTSLSGDYVHTVSYVDAATYWVIPCAQWNKGAEATRESVSLMAEKLPVPLKEVHPDTGSEFINYHLKGWCDERGIAMSRSEPGKSNDNMYIEERNGHVVRKYVGYTRLDCRDTLPLMQELYSTLALYLNHFQAVRRTQAKERVGAQIKRTYEKRPQTPYHRMLAHPQVEEEVKSALRETHEPLNPLLLKREIDRLVGTIMKIQKKATTKN
jgi:hypothetical protein